ncbi:hypothetical protein [Mycolicibacterium sp.]|uniref:hypothetical protein n=1 Tax=Mycolicibacterium sp. TaxID=2320850 RepID=UPI003D126887
MTRLALWQRNVIGAVVTVAALGGVAAMDLWPAWSHYRDSVVPAHVVPARESVTVGGQTWSLGPVRYIGDRPGLGRIPPGTVVTLVTVRRDGPTPPGAACVGVLTDGHRRWRGESPITYSIPATADQGFTCTKDGSLQWAFLVPDDAVPTALDVTAPNGTILLRLQLS